MNIHIMSSRTNLLHLIAFLLVCTTVFLTVAAPIQADQCEQWRQKRDEAQSDADTYQREAEDYKKKYDNASWANPMKYYYYSITVLWTKCLKRCKNGTNTRKKLTKTAATAPAVVVTAPAVVVVSGTFCPPHGN